jgi:hypothetical protein
MSMNITLATPEFIKAEIEARYGERPQRRRLRGASSLKIERRAHRRRTDEVNRLARIATAH